MTNGRSIKKFSTNARPLIINSHLAHLCFKTAGDTDFNYQHPNRDLFFASKFRQPEFRLKCIDDRGVGVQPWIK